MRTLFIGSTKRGYLSLKTLCDVNAQVVGVISLQQDKHEKENYEKQIRELCLEKNIPIYESKLVTTEKYKTIIEKDLKPEVCFVVGARVLIPKEIYSIPTKGSLAVHDSLLPKYRGFAPLNWSIINGESKTGATLFYLNEKMDEGDYIGQVEIPIEKNDYAHNVYEKVCQATLDLIKDGYSKLKENKELRQSQNHSEATYTCARSPVDGKIHWNQTSDSIINLIRGLSDPYPGAFTFYQGDIIKIWTAIKVDNPRKYVGHICGKIVDIDSKDGHVDVLTSDGVIRIFEIGTKSSYRLNAAEVIKSVRENLGIENYVELTNKLY